MTIAIKITPPYFQQTLETKVDFALLKCRKLEKITSGMTIL